MKRIFTFIGAALLVASAAQVQAQVGTANALYPGLTEETAVLEYKAPRATTPPVIDGNPTDAAWQLAPWKPAMRVANYNSTWGTTPQVDPVGPFSGVADCEFKYKFVWDNDRYYLLMYWKDDNVIYSDIHDGYVRMPVKPDFMTGATYPANGAGTGAAYLTYLMDQISVMITNYSAILVAGTGTGTASYNRNTNSLWYGFYPAMLTHSTHVGAILWGQLNSLPTGVTVPQQVTVAGRYDEVEKAYYIEFADANWNVLFGTVNRARLTDQKDFATTPVAVGDKFLFNGEINDADSNTNRRDYSLFIGSKLTNPNQKATEAVVVELVETVPQGLSNPKANNSLEIYPNVTSGNTISLSREADVQFFNLSGHKILDSKNATVINISSLKQGIYIVKDSKGNVNRLVRN